MPVRALIVLLLILNVGVASWWLTRPLPSPGEPAPAPAGVPRLQLAGTSQPAPAAGAGDTAIAQAPAASTDHCVSYGPFDSADAVEQYRQRVQALVGVRTRTREAAGGPYRGWKVWLPPYASLEEVDAVSQRVAAAGFSDRFVVREGRDANSLALGRFTGEVSARQHAAALAAAGFPARAEPVGTGPVRHWLEVAGPSDDAERLRSLAAAEAREFDCATWTEGGAV